MESKGRQACKGAPWVIEAQALAAIRIGRPHLLADRVDHQNVALVMAYGLALPGGRRMIRMGHVHAHMAYLMVRKVEQGDLVLPRRPVRIRPKAAPVGPWSFWRMNWSGSPSTTTSNELKPWRKDMWCIPQVDGEFVARMEDVLDLCAEAPDPKRPVVCFDESPTQLIGEVRQPIKAEPARSSAMT